MFIGTQINADYTDGKRIKDLGQRVKQRTQLKDQLHFFQMFDIVQIFWRT